MSNLIDRESAVCTLMSLIVPLEEYHDFNHGINDACVEIMKLPAVEPEQQTGEWISPEPGRSYPDYWQCSECGYVVMHWNNTLYCPRCGSKMKNGV